MSYAGRGMPGLTNTKLVAGRGAFVDDIQLARMGYAAILRSPLAHAHPLDRRERRRGAAGRAVRADRPRGRRADEPDSGDVRHRSSRCQGRPLVCPLRRPGALRRGGRGRRGRGEQIHLVKAGAEEAGRDPDEMETTLYTAIWVSDDLAQARRMTRWAAACAANHIVDVMKNVPDHGMPPVLTRLGELGSEHYDYASPLDPSVERPDYPDDVIDRFAFNGQPERIVEMLKALAEVGLEARWRPAI